MEDKNIYFFFVVNDEVDSEMETLLDLSHSEMEGWGDTDLEMIPEDCCKFIFKYF